MRATLSGAVALTRLVPITASLALHVGLVGAVLVMAGATASRDQVIFLELTELEAPPEPSRPAIAPRPPDPPRTVKPIRTPPPPPERPMLLEPPSRVEPASGEPPTTAAISPTSVSPGPSTPAATGPTSSGETAGPASAVPSTTTTDVTSRAEVGAAASASPPAPLVAAVPRTGITQRAIPRAEYQYRPAYPRSARDRGIQGTTVLAVLVADDGRVADVVIKESAGHRALDEAAADAVRRWRFAPARRDGEAVAVWVELPVEFRLR